MRLWRNKSDSKFSSTSWFEVCSQMAQCFTYIHSPPPPPGFRRVLLGLGSRTRMQTDLGLDSRLHPHFLREALEPGAEPEGEPWLWATARWAGSQERPTAQPVPHFHPGHFSREGRNQALLCMCVCMHAHI